ncbi:MAG: alpha/beta hydrolase [Vicinamibacterales bacterium]
MRLTRRSFFSVAALSPLACSGARTDAIVQDGAPLGPGRHRLGLSNGRDGVIIVPASYQPSTPSPLIVMLHGAGGTGEGIASRFGLAEEFGLILLAPDSRSERTWDLIMGRFGPDVEFITDAVASIKRRCAIEASHVTIAGFSDGASYALSYGIGAGDTFSRIIAFSPGLLQPRPAQGKPRIFISHGDADNILPIDVTSRAIVPKLKGLGYDVTYQEFQGRHTVPPEVARKAFEWNRA